MQKPHKEQKSTNPFELPEERLSTTTSTGERHYIYQADVKGRFHNRHAIVHTILVLIFLILPWIQVNGEQFFLLDIANRHFNIFGLHLWAHDAPLLVLLLLGFLLSMGLLTALLGRFWCGWSCPQTVFVESIFKRVERWVEGSAVQRRRLDQGKLTVKAIGKKAIKWIVFSLISLGITHSFLAYFVGARKVIEMMHHSPTEHPASFITIMLSTAVILFDFGWFREQFCVIACPYGRFQSVLMDEYSLTVSYDTKRGEPRATDRERTEKSGDCINCYRCVQVCPTGIDIRRGLQMECIMCNACIDACDTVMEKIGKPKGLIRLASEKSILGLPQKWIRARVIIYSLLLTIVLSILSFLITNRPELEITLLRAKEAPYTLLENQNKIMNHVRLSLHNNTSHMLSLELAQEEDDIKLITPISPFVIQAGKYARFELFIEFSPERIQYHNGPLKLYLVDKANNHQFKLKVPLVGPEHHRADGNHSLDDD